MSRIFAFLVAVACIAALAGSAGALRALAATVTPVDKLSLAERLTTAPDSTVVQIGPNTLTLGQMRAAHRARQAAFENATQLGHAAASSLTKTLGEGIRPIARGTPGLINVTVEPLPLQEPASQYSSAPPDMRAFCSAAHASACLYLPPNQQVSLYQGMVIDYDYLITQQQCSQEGGYYSGMWNTYSCQFNYPASVVVNFTPAASYKLSQSAHCDPAFRYQVDDHGAVGISATFSSQFTTDNSPSCIVMVTPGG